MAIKKVKDYFSNKEKQIELLAISAALSGVFSIGGLFLGKPVVMATGISSNLVLSSAANHRAKKFYESEIDNLRSFQLDQVTSVESQANEALVAEVDRLKTQAAKLIQEKEDEWEQLLKDSESKVRSKAKLIDDLEAEKKQLVQNLRELQLKLDQLNSERQEQLDSLRGREIALKTAETEAEYRISNYASEMATGWEKLKFERENLEREQLALEKAAEELSASVAQEILGYQQRIKQLEAQIALHAAPQLSNGHKEADSIANQIINFYWDQETVLDFRTSFQNESSFYVRLKPRDDSVSIKDLEKHGEAIQRLLNSAKPPTFKLHYSEIQIDLTFQSESKSSIIQPVNTWLEDALMQEKEGKLRPNHARFVGESESGKSSLVNNCLGILKKHVPDLTVKLADPLYESGESNWDFIPTYKDSDECFEGLVKTAELVQTRIDNASLNRYPQLLIVDEIDDLIAQYGEEATKAIRKIWKQGRHVSVWLWVLGQSPYCKNLKMGIYDLKNAINFFIGTTIPKGLGEFCPTPDREDMWLKQYQLRLDENQQYLVACCPKRQQPFLAEMPTPGKFASKSLMAELVNSKPLQPSLNGTSSGLLTSSERFSNEPVANQLLTSCEPVDSKNETIDSTGLEPDESRIKALLEQGQKPHEVVVSIWGIKPSKSKKYQDKLRLVEAIAS